MALPSTVWCLPERFKLPSGHWRNLKNLIRKWFFEIMCCSSKVDKMFCTNLDSTIIVLITNVFKEHFTSFVEKAWQRIKWWINGLVGLCLQTSNATIFVAFLKSVSYLLWCLVKIILGSFDLISTLDHNYPRCDVSSKAASTLYK